MKSGANLVEEMNGSGCRPSPTPAGGSLTLAAQLILIQFFSYHLSPFLFWCCLFLTLCTVLLLFGGLCFES